MLSIKFTSPQSQHNQRRCCLIPHRIDLEIQATMLVYLMIKTADNEHLYPRRYLTCRN